MIDFALIAAVSENGVIGNNGDMPWGRSYKEDLKRFRELTLDHAIIMGNNTLKSIGKPLEKRHNIVLTRDQSLQSKENLIYCNSLEKALHEARCYSYSKGYSKSYIIGGQSIYENTIDKANFLEITEIHKNFEGDTYFPKINSNEWEEISRKDLGEISFVTYERVYENI